jgi:stringent starvation protein B
MSSMSSTHPYLIRAMHEWISDNNQTPQIIVDATVDGVEVPVGHIKDGRIVLNIGFSATANLQLGNEFISFDARFDGKASSIILPVAAVQGIYASESGQGMFFASDPDEIAADVEQSTLDGVGKEPEKEEDGKRGPSPKVSHLKVVK